MTGNYNWWCNGNIIQMKLPFACVFMGALTTVFDWNSRVCYIIYPLSVLVVLYIGYTSTYAPIKLFFPPWRRENFTCSWSLCPYGTPLQGYYPCFTLCLCGSILKPSCWQWHSQSYRLWHQYQWIFCFPEGSYLCDPLISHDQYQSHQPRLNELCRYKGLLYSILHALYPGSWSVILTSICTMF